MIRCAKSNLLILIPKRDQVLTFPSWFVLFSPNNDRPFPVFVRSLAEYGAFSLEPTGSGCSSVFNQNYIGKCELVFATCDDSVNVLNRSTETLGHKESMLPVSARVQKPWAKPFEYSHQEFYCLVKHFGYWNEEGTNTEDCFLMQAYIRPVPQSKWNLNKSFGTPLELLNRVVEKEWKEISDGLPSGLPSVPVYTLDAQNRIITVTATSTGRISHMQAKVIFAKIVGDGFELRGKELITKGDVNLNISYPELNTPGVVFNL